MKKKRWLEAAGILVAGVLCFVRGSAAQTLEQANAAYADGRYGDALSEYQLLAQSQSSAGAAEQAEYKIAWCRWKLKERPAAIADMEKFIAQRLDSSLCPAAKVDLAGFRVQEKDFAGALQEMTKFLQGNPEPVLARRARFLTAEAQWGLKNFEAALPLYQAVVDSAPDSPLAGRARLRLIERQYSQGPEGRNQATDEFLQFAAGREGTVEGVRGRIRAAHGLQNQGKLDEAEQIFRELLQTQLIPSQEGIVRRDLARLLNVAGKHAEALAALQERTTEPEAEKERENIAFWKARSLFLDAKYDQSLEKMSALIQQYPQSKWIPQALMMEAVSALRLSQGDAIPEGQSAQELTALAGQLRTEALEAGAKAGDPYIALQVYFYWGDMQNLKTAAEAMLAAQTEHNRRWAQAKLWLAVAEGMGPEKKYTEAIQQCDEILAQPLTDADEPTPPWETDIPTAAAWRGAYFAQQLENPEIVRHFAAILRDQMPNSPERDRGLKEFGGYLETEAVAP